MFDTFCIRVMVISENKKDIKTKRLIFVERKHRQLKENELLEIYMKKDVEALNIAEFTRNERVLLVILRETLEDYDNNTLKY